MKGECIAIFAVATLAAASITIASAQETSRVVLPGGADVIVIIPDSLADPPRTLSELLRERVPSAMVNRSSGALGASAFVSLRDQSVVRGDNPLVVIDGVRQVSYRSGVDTLSRAAPSVLDDVMLEDVARIEVLNGPAAAAGYGYDGQRGVIVVTTRAPGAGSPHFRASASVVAADDDAGYARNLAGVSAAGLPCAYFQQAQGSCTAATSSRFTPVLDYSPFRVGTSARAQLGVSGGVARIGYAAALGGEHGTGTMDADAADRISGSLRLAVPVRRDVHLAFASFASERGVSTPVEGESSFIGWGIAGRPLDCSPATPCGGDSTTHGYTFGPPSFLASRGSRRRIGRVGGGLTLTIDPRPALSLTTSLAGDMFRDKAWLRDSTPHEPLPGASESYSLSTATERNWRVGAGQDVALTRALGSAVSTTRLTIGYQAERSRDDRGSLFAAISSGGVSASAASSWYALYRDRVELSFDERIAIGERGGIGGGAIRTWTRAGDAHFAAVVDPHADLFYDLVAPGRPLGALSVLRLRAAAARTSGFDLRMIQRRFYTAAQTLPSGSFADRRPDRSTEVEGGFDLGIAPAELRVSVTAFNRRDGIRDIFPVVLYPNIIDISSHSREIKGGELTIDATPLAMDEARLHLRGQLAISHDRVTGDLPDLALAPLDGVAMSVANARSWGAWIGTPYSWSDANGDGRVESNEVDDSGFVPSNFGRSRPSNVASLSADLRVARSWTVSAVMDHVGGFKVFDMAGLLQCFALACPALTDPRAPLAEQARAVAVATNTTFAPFLVPGDATGLRELALSWTSSSRAAMVGASSLRVTASAHDLATWTRAKGVHPETDIPPAGQQEGLLWSVVQTVPRTFAVRVALTY